MNTSPFIRISPHKPTLPAQGLDDAWERCGDSFCRYFTVRVDGDQHLTDDLMQQLWLRAKQSHDAARTENVEAWMWRIAQTLLREHYRTKGRRHRIQSRIDAAMGQRLADQIGSQEIPLDSLIKREVQDLLLLALTGLPCEEQELLVGRYFENRSHAYLAAKLGISDRAVEGVLFRARSRLRDALQSLENEE